MHEGLFEVSSISPSIHLAEVPPKLIWPGKQLNFNGVLCESDLSDLNEKLMLICNIHDLAIL